jgi:hypothetical protein
MEDAAVNQQGWNLSTERNQNTHAHILCGYHAIKCGM